MNLNKMKVKEKADDFAGRLKAIRKEVKLRQDEFCKKLDISSTQLSKIENGKNKPGHGFYVNNRRCQVIYSPGKKLSYPLEKAYQLVDQQIVSYL